MFKNPLVLFNKLCGAAKVYLVISIISYIALFYQNYNEPKKYCVGMFQANTNCDNNYISANFNAPLTMLTIHVLNFSLSKIPPATQ